MFSVGMATYDDFNGVYFSVQSLILYHRKWLKEIIVVDNNPNSVQGKTTREYCKSVSINYVPLHDPKGTAAPRNAVFQNATGEHVVCIDSHVLLHNGAFECLAAYYKDNPKSGNLLQGPMVYDWMNQYEDHFSDDWGSGMYGQWASSWMMPGNNMVVSPVVRNGKTMYRDVKLQDFYYDGPEVDWMRLDQQLLSYGFTRPIMPFDIPAMGLGLFACRKDSWLGFNPDFRGFGGEEWYIHLKFRKAGRRTLCLPGLRWNHRFSRPQGIPYVNDKYDTFANYVKGFRELGIPLDRAVEHYTKVLNFPAPYISLLLSDPYAPHPERVKGGCTSCDKLPELYKRAVDTPSDINEHVPTLNSLARQCEHVTEFGTRHGVSTVALLHANPKRMISYDKQESGVARQLMKMAPAFEFKIGDSTEVDIEPTDLLFIDTYHTGEHLAKELEKHHSKVKRYIVMHDTVIFGNIGEDGKPGLLSAIVAFIKAHPEWTMIHHYPNNHGLMVLSKSDEDKKALPGLLTQAMNYTKAVTKDKLAGSPRVPLEIASGRMAICMLCDKHTNGRCAECGCPVAEKTQWGKEQCPLKKW